MACPMPHAPYLLLSGLSCRQPPALPAVVRFVMASNEEGMPSKEDVANSAPLIVLPRTAKDDVHR